VSEINPVELDLPTLVSLAGSAANQHLLRRLHEDGYAGVRTSHGYVIQNLIDETPTVGELAVRLGVTQQAASKAVVEMEGMRLVARVPDPADSRVRRVTLTARGQALLAAGRAVRAELEETVAAEGGSLDVAKRVLVSLLEHTGHLDAVARRRVPLAADDPGNSGSKSLVPDKS
jgi:DNA-binding MarR family transcriptional regulator